MTDIPEHVAEYLPGKPGIHTVHEAIYRAWPFVNQSLLKLFERSPAHARYAMTHPSEQTPAMALGQATHCAILEPGRFEQEYATAPEGLDRRTKGGKATWAALLDTGKEILRAPETERISEMQHAVWSHPVAKRLLEGEGVNEVSIVWDDYTEVNGDECTIRCMGRIDRLAADFEGWPAKVEIKTTDNASPWRWPWQVWKYKYHVQDAMYRRGLTALAPTERRHFTIAVESDPPHCVGVYELDDASLALGDQVIDKRLAQWAKCEKTGEWPAYSPRIESVTLPEQAWKEFGG